MIVDFVLNPFGAEMADLVEMAKAADDADVGAVWVSDHFSGHVVGAPWSRDPLVCLGAMAAVTAEVDVGLLVANAYNRHPVQLASAINSLQSLAPGRVRLGIGSGAAPGSRFASEHDMIGRRLEDLPTRRQHLADSIEALCALWTGATDFASSTVGFSDLSGVVDAASRPQIIVGASAWPTIAVAVEHADGVNIRRTNQLTAHLDRLEQMDLPADFEVSVLDNYEVGRPLEDLPGDLDRSRVDRYIVTLSTSRDLEALRRMPRRR